MTLENAEREKESLRRELESSQGALAATQAENTGLRVRIEGAAVTSADLQERMSAFQTEVSHELSLSFVLTLSYYICFC